MAVPQMADQRADRGPTEAPEDVLQRIGRAQVRMRELMPGRNECWQFFRGNTYHYVTQDNLLTSQATAPSTNGKGKPNHRVRTKRPIHMPIIRQEVSYATQRVPSYETNPSNGDPETQNAAHISQQIALYGYDKWDIKRVTEKVVTHALVADEGFAWPYWDYTVGPKVAEDPEGGRDLHQGEIKIRTFSSNEVGWEPGVDFEDSKWWIIVQARPLDEVTSTPGYVHGKEPLVADARSHNNIGTGKPTQNNLVLVTEYLERPNPKHKKGRRLCIANNRLISPVYDYPLVGPDGEVLDEPVLHKLSWMVDPDSDRDLGLMRFLLDIVRTYQDCVNKQAEWKNLAANPQMFKKPGLQIQLNDEPGAVFNVSDPQAIEWRPIPPAPTLLSEMADRCLQELGFLSSQNDIPNQVEAARAIQVLVERDAQARSAFISNLAQWHSRLMRHCLTLVQRHYTEKRLIKVNGWKGADRIENFKGADLMGQVDVRVNPGSIEPYTRAYIEQRINMWAQMGWVTREEAMTAVENGTAVAIINKIQLDVGRANWIIQRLFEDNDALMAQESEDRMVIDPMTGMQTMQKVPWWMPRQFDRIPVYKGEFEDAMKTQRYDLAPAHIKAQLNVVYNALLALEQQEAQRQQMLQMDQAAQLGMANAAQPQTQTSPSVPGISGAGGQVDPAAGEGSPFA